MILLMKKVQARNTLDYKGLESVPAILMYP